MHSQRGAHEFFGTFVDAGLDDVGPLDGGTNPLGFTPIVATHFPFPGYGKGVLVFTPDSVLGDGSTDCFRATASHQD
jgi:hypothetical protein